MKKLLLLVLLFSVLILPFEVTRANAQGHKVLILGDSLTINGGWPDLVEYDHTIVAKVSMDTNWVKDRLTELVTSGEILEYDSAVVWIGVSGTFYALTGIPEIYDLLHSYGIKIVGITQYKHNYLGLATDLTYRQIDEYNEIIRTQADAVVDLAVDPNVVDSKGFVHLSITQDGLHPYISFSKDYFSNLVNEKLSEVYQSTGEIVSVVSSDHRVLLFGDSLSSANLNKWHEFITYDHLLVAKGGENSSWVIDQIDGLVASGEILKYDTAVVWIGVNDPVLAIKEIPEIYATLHSMNIKVIGVTQWLHYCEVGSQTLDSIPLFNEIVRSQADLVLDFAVDPRFVSESGYINKEAAGDCIHMNWGMTQTVAGAVNGAVDKLYAPTPTPVPTETLEPTATLEPTVTATPTTVATAIVQATESDWAEQPESTNRNVLYLFLVVILVFAIGGLKASR